MKTTTYPIVCRSCNGNGTTRNEIFDGTSLVQVTTCRACNGDGVVIATTTEDHNQPGVTYCGPGNLIGGV